MSQWELLKLRFNQVLMRQNPYVSHNTRNRICTEGKRKSVEKNNVEGMSYQLCCPRYSGA